MNVFINGLIAGYGIAIPVGAIAILIVSMGMRCGLKIGLAAGAGAATADIFYALVAAITGTALIAVLKPFSFGLQVLSGTLLVGMGLWGLWTGIKGGKKDNQDAEICTAVKMYFQFIGLTIINPLTIVYFAALILGLGDASFNLTSGILFVLGVGVATLSWQSLLAYLGAVSGHQLSEKFQLYAIIVGNLVVTILGVRIFYSLMA